MRTERRFMIAAGGHVRQSPGRCSRPRSVLLRLAAGLTSRGYLAAPAT